MYHSQLGIIIQNDPHVFHQEGGIQIPANAGGKLVIDLHFIAGDVYFKTEVPDIVRIMFDQIAQSQIMGGKQPGKFVFLQLFDQGN